MKRTEIAQWAEGIIAGDKRVDWQRGPISGQDIARIVRAEDYDATDDDLGAIAELVNQR